MPEYVAITTINAQTSDYRVVARGTDKDVVRDVARAAIDGVDIYAETEHKNLRVLSKTQARRLAGRCALGECDHDHGHDA